MLWLELKGGVSFVIVIGLNLIRHNKDLLFGVLVRIFLASICRNSTNSSPGNWFTFKFFLSWKGSKLLLVIFTDLYGETCLHFFYFKEQCNWAGFSYVSKEQAFLRHENVSARLPCWNHGLPYMEYFGGLTEKDPIRFLVPNCFQIAERIQKKFQMQKRGYEQTHKFILQVTREPKHLVSRNQTMT